MAACRGKGVYNAYRGGVHFVRGGVRGFIMDSWAHDITTYGASILALFSRLLFAPVVLVRHRERDALAIGWDDGTFGPFYILLVLEIIPRTNREMMLR